MLNSVGKKVTKEIDMRGFLDQHSMIKPAECSDNKGMYAEMMALVSKASS
jgi:hypothetical protein